MFPSSPAAQRSGGRGRVGFAFVDRGVSFPSPCRGRTGAQPTATQLAAESHQTTGDEVRVERGVAWLDGRLEGVVEVPAWTFGIGCSHRRQFFKGNAHQLSAFSCAPLPQTAFTSPPVSPHLPMWPQTGRVWPSSHSAPGGRGVGEAWVPA